MPEELRPARVIPPGEFLKDELEARGWTQRDLADVLGRPAQVVSEIINGKKQITPETSIELGEALGTSPEFWHNLESRYQQRLATKQSRDGAIAKRSRLFTILPLRQMRQRGWLHGGEATEDLEREVLSFLRLDSVEAPPALAASFRCANVRQPEPYAQLAWLRRVEQVAATKDAAPFAPPCLRPSLDRLLGLTRSAEDVLTVPQALAEAGVRLVLVPHLQRTYVDGAALWLGGCPVVALTLRYNRIDAFWFTLLHEFAHILDQAERREPGQPIVDQLFDDDLAPGEVADDRDNCQEEERSANQAAADWLVPPGRLASFVRHAGPHLSGAEIEAFAEAIGRHPGIVLGRLQKDGRVPYRNLRQLLVKVSPYLVGHTDS
ncbi:MAG: HigA family addiction module antitoxin [Anaerolineae bacterium]